MTFPVLPLPASTVGSQTTGRRSEITNSGRMEERKRSNRGQTSAPITPFVIDYMRKTQIIDRIT